MKKIIIDIDTGTVDKEGDVRLLDVFDISIALLDLAYSGAKNDPKSGEEFLNELENVITETVQEIFNKKEDQ